MIIGKMTMETMKMLIDELLDGHAGEINKAFLKSEDNGLKISISLDIGVSGKIANGVDVDATISFVAEKVKEKVSKTVSENQQELFKAVEKLRPKPGDGIDSVTFSSGDKSVTLEARK